ncbi:hypothetical protein MFLAVUS_002771 [Mucor flavus]|uniref:Homeobox domain-containing protein n=1 Tax=Mucor flavus TaxID=439312 RepID=A0ABP9YR76_9FUNG
MSPEMLMQPFEQSFTVVPINNGYYHHNNTMTNKLIEQEDENAYMMGYPMMEGTNSSDFRPTFYNPFEIKHRRRTSRAQLKVLEKSFLENPKPNATVRRILAQKLDMTPRGVQIWFQNRRAKAKLQRRKSGEGQQEDHQIQHHQHHQQQNQQQQQDSPVLFSQFFNNLKAWDNNARSIANVAAASCMFDSNDNSDLLLDQQQSSSVKIDEWLKLPIHPLAPVIDSSDDFDFSSSPIMSSEEWRRKSCPALGSKLPQQNSDSWSAMNNYHIENNNRRMTEDLLLSTNRFVQPYPMMKSTLTNNSECNTPKWNGTPVTSSMDFYSNLNYSPMSQQLTPMLSTGSPVSSVDGNYYDSCLDLIMSSDASSSMI